MGLKGKAVVNAAWFAVAGNAVLAILKLVVGFISGSFMVIADGIDSATDIISSVVTLIAAKMVVRPPNIRFPYGYVKADTVATKGLSMLLFLAGAQLAIATVRRLLGGEIDSVPGNLAIYVTIVSMLGKFILSVHLRSTGKKQNSSMLRTMGIHMRNDMLISGTVLIGLIAAISLELAILDKIIALAISLFIMVEAVRIFLKSNTELMDGTNNPELYDRIFEAIKEVDGAHNPHRARARNIGSYIMINLDIEIDPDLSVRNAHDIAKKVEDKIKEGIENVYDVMVHIEPLGNLEKDEKFGISEKDMKNPG